MEENLKGFCACRSARENQSAQATAGPQNQQSFQIFIEVNDLFRELSPSIYYF